MSTRSTIKFKTPRFEWTIYQQYDGYHDGVGKEVAEFFANIKIVNGFHQQEAGEYANGFECAVLQFLAKIKTGIGGVYATSNEDSQQYNYVVQYLGAGDIRFEADGFYDEERDRPLSDYVGTPQGFLDVIKEKV